MSNVVFEESGPEQLGQSQFHGQMNSQESRGIVGFLIKKGWAKDKKGANLIMIAIIVVCAAVTIFQGFSTISSLNTPSDRESLNNIGSLPLAR